MLRQHQHRLAIARGEQLRSDLLQGLERPRDGPADQVGDRGTCLQQALQQRLKQQQQGGEQAYADQGPGCAHGDAGERDGSLEWKCNGQDRHG